MKRLAGRLAFTVAVILLLALLPLALLRPESPAPGTATPGTGAAPAAGYHPHAAPPGPGPDPFCAGCHPHPPHRRGPQHRNILNHHALTVGCLVCHGAPFVRPADVVAGKGGLAVAPGGSAPAAGVEESWRAQALRSGPCFSPGPGCLECHRPGGLLNFSRLGFDAQRVERLERLEEFFTRPPRQPWYFPGIL